MTRLAHLSDLHFGRVDPLAVAALRRDLEVQAPDLVVVSGDLTQRARTRQFQEAKAFLESLGRPLLVVPGNHDVPWHVLPSRFLGPHGRFRRLISPEIRPIQNHGPMIVAGLPTSRAAVPHWNWALGRVSTSGAQRVAEAFHLHHGQGPRVLVTHHPLAPVADWSGRHVAFNADRALSILGGARVDLLLAGHVHVSRATTLDLPRGQRGGEAWTCVAAQAASATSTRLRGEPNAYNLVDLSAQAMTVQVRLWDPARPDFEAGETRRFAQGDGGWRDVPAGRPSE